MLGGTICKRERERGREREEGREERVRGDRAERERGVTGNIHSPSEQSNARHRLVPRSQTEAIPLRVVSEASEGGREAGRQSKSRRTNVMGLSQLHRLVKHHIDLNKQSFAHEICLDGVHGLGSSER
jgi:hypothetical protein